MFERFNNYINDISWKINIHEGTINIVNYLDVITLEENRISIKYSSGMFIIKGNNLSVNKLLESEILISGNIKSIEFE